MMEVMVITEAIESAKHRLAISCLQAGCPFCHPTNSVKNRRETVSHSADCHLPTQVHQVDLSLTTKVFWLPLKGCQAPRQSSED